MRERRGADFRSAHQERALGWRRLDEMERWGGHHRFQERIFGCFVAVWGECCGWQEQRCGGLGALGRSRWRRRAAWWGGWSQPCEVFVDHVKEYGFYIVLLSTYNFDTLLWKSNSVDLPREALLCELWQSPLYQRCSPGPPGASDLPCGFLQPVLLPILLHAAQPARHVPAFRPCRLPFLMPWLLCSFFFWYSGLSWNRQALVSAQGCWKCWVCLRRAASDSGPRGLAPRSGSGGCSSSPPAPWPCLALAAPLFPLIYFSWSFLSCPLLGTLVPVVLCGSGQETWYFYL